MANYLAIIASRIKEVAALVISTGAPDAGKIVATDGSGKLDISLMPAGVSSEVTVCPAFEALAAGDFINLFLSGGVIQARKADASSPSKEANGFVLASVLIGAPATVYSIGAKNTALSGLTIGSYYYLSDVTPGGVLIDPGPVASGTIVQQLGIAESTSAMIFSKNLTVQLV